VRSMLNWKTLGVLFLGISGFVVAGCKSAPDLTSTQALALVQAKYDQTAPVGVNILVNDPGMMSGATAKLWERTKVYPDTGRQEGCSAPGRRRRNRMAAAERR
jgi:hypothetical protein